MDLQILIVGEKEKQQGLDNSKSMNQDKARFMLKVGGIYTQNLAIQAGFESDGI